VFVITQTEFEVYAVQFIIGVVVSSTVLQCVAVWCSVLRCVEMCCIVSCHSLLVLQCGVVDERERQRVSEKERERE